MIWISYTTRYRTGSDKFARAAETMRQELAAKHPGVEVRLDPLVRKGDFVAALARIAGEGKQLAQLHFLGHSQDAQRLHRVHHDEGNEEHRSRHHRAPEDLHE